MSLIMEDILEYSGVSEEREILNNIIDVFGEELIIVESFGQIKKVIKKNSLSNSLGDLKYIRGMVENLRRESIKRKIDPKEGIDRLNEIVNRIDKEKQDSESELRQKKASEAKRNGGQLTKEQEKAFEEDAVEDYKRVVAPLTRELQRVFEEVAQKVLKKGSFGKKLRKALLIAILAGTGGHVVSGTAEAIVRNAYDDQGRGAYTQAAGNMVKFSQQRSEVDEADNQEIQGRRFTDLKKNALGRLESYAHDLAAIKAADNQVLDHIKEIQRVLSEVKSGIEGNSGATKTQQLMTLINGGKQKLEDSINEMREYSAELRKGAADAAGKAALEQMNQIAKGATNVNTSLNEFIKYSDAERSEGATGTARTAKDRAGTSSANKVADLIAAGREIDARTLNAALGLRPTRLAISFIERKENTDLSQWKKDLVLVLKNIGQDKAKIVERYLQQHSSPSVYTEARKESFKYFNY